MLSVNKIGKPRSSLEIPQHCSFKNLNESWRIQKFIQMGLVQWSFMLIFHLQHWCAILSQVHFLVAPLPVYVLGHLCLYGRNGESSCLQMWLSSTHDGHFKSVPEEGTFLFIKPPCLCTYLSSNNIQRNLLKIIQNGRDFQEFTECSNIQ